MAKPRIGIIVGSVRQGRFADHPANWINEVAKQRPEIDVELLDLRDYPMPFFEEATSPAWGPSKNAVAQRWQKKVASLDGFIMVTSEYNRGPPASLKNALDYAYNEWVRKPVAFVGYGGVGGARAVEQLRLNCVELQMAPTRFGVHILFPVYLGVLKEGKKFDDYPEIVSSAKDMLDHLVWWTKTLKDAREGASAEAAKAA